MTPTPTARRTVADDGTATIELAGLDQETADRAATIIGAALDLDIEDAVPPAARAKGEAKLSAPMSVAELEHELGIHRRDRALDEWEKTGEVL